ncbi:Glycine dehydrogenase (decarboxylating) [BD1-7 clade bacterium]|uniref:Glycine dehydrogenase (decarboxylating) n=1 Tax=BD1-7 clade bacterium TaxID=2029982 RepID=A0A5S9NYG7_9GAMM|nr:Glycine dehydrogenase (decarboxylating) [BD1-7 clade bacterium]CAA0095767.1 Glycine dehydrogenase (decarboxylating) [BD1-7 clade bacterium]
MSSIDQLFNNTEFVGRHIGPSDQDTRQMLQTVGAADLNDLMQQTIPANIFRTEPLALNQAENEAQTLKRLKAMASENILNTNYIGMGYYPTHTPPVILRNVFENPGWYTAYTPYQPEIAQGRLEALINFQQMVMDLTAMPLANASLLDEATAAAEAMAMSHRVVKKNKSNAYFVDQNCHPQTIAVLTTRAQHFDFELIVGDVFTDLENENVFGALIQYPDTRGSASDLTEVISKAHDKNAIVTVATDLLALCLLKPPGEMDADIVIGNSQRFGVPMGFGGPHAAFFACKEAYKRALPGRIIGVSKDSNGQMAYRMALQTREQHIRREKATSNICTSQALLAIMASCYAVYHGPQGLKRIAERVHQLTSATAKALNNAGVTTNQTAFDTLSLAAADQTDRLYQAALDSGINLRRTDNETLGISFNEETTVVDLTALFAVFGLSSEALDSQITDATSLIPADLQRQSEFLKHEIFNCYHSETEMLRYLKRLENKDVTLTHSMIPLGSCTMKLNATAEMIPVTWPEFANMHPFAPEAQTRGYQKMLDELHDMLVVCTGYDAVSLQPNAGSQGEYAGLLAIKSYLESQGQYERNICLIPSSAHGTNPASAAMVGMKVVITKCDADGNVDIDDLKEKIAQHRDNIACIMVTYPSTHGVFEEGITEICEIVHEAGGQVYVDGANLNAIVGVAAPGKFGADVSHLNLHKTFAIPHGGGGPGMGPIGVKSHLSPFLPGNPLNDAETNTVSAARFGSAGILPISWAYIHMMGSIGMRSATEIAILNANYISQRLKSVYPILYTGQNGRVAHECIVDIRPIKEATGISEEDIAKRLMDFGFHGPTMSFPVAGTLMIEPTESESKAELDRFCDSMIAIYEEIMKVKEGIWTLEDNPLVNAPHTHENLMTDNWDHLYTREEAAYPLASLRQNKYWPPVGRIDNVYGDRNLFCACPSIDDYTN